MTYKELIMQNFYASHYKPLLYKYVELLDIFLLSDGERIDVNLSEGKIDDGLYILERRGASLFFYRAGHFKKVLIVNDNGIFSYTPNQLKKSKETGAMITTQQWQRFFAKN